MRTLHHEFVETFTNLRAGSLYGESWALTGILLDCGVRGSQLGHELGLN